MSRFTALAFGAALFMSAPAIAQTTPAAEAQPAPERIFQGTSLLGERLYATSQTRLYVAPETGLDAAIARARAAFEQNNNVQNAVWYGRLLGYRSHMREAVDVFTAGLRRNPNSARLYRHRAHRYFSLRQFDRSIADGLRAAQLYQGQPLEREPLVDYYPADPDIVQFYTYYHLGQAYFAKQQYNEAATWFRRSADATPTGDDPDNIVATTYWIFLSLARGGRVAEAQEVLDNFTLTLRDLSPTSPNIFYFDGIQLFKGNRGANSFFPPGAADANLGSAAAASMSYSLANYHLLRGERELAKPHLANVIRAESWGMFARIQAEADWVLTFPGEQPQ